MRVSALLDAQPTGEAAAVDHGSLSELRYGADTRTAFLSGINALARLPLDQRRLDLRAGRDTAGFVSGYRGSPLGGLDQELWRQAAYLDALGVVFQPGVNEDLAATAVWGSQQVGLFPGAKHEGVFGLWYGKAPGLDRSSDAIRHANAAGTSPLGGVLLAVGDDPGCKSSTLPSASEFALRDLQIPVLAPAHAADVLDFGLFGWALSRYAGCWVALVLVADVMDGAMTVTTDLARHVFASPAHTERPHIRVPDAPLDQEARMAVKLGLVARFAAAGRIDRLIANPRDPRLVLVCAGKVYADARDALAKLGLATPAALAAAGVRLVKLGLTWPLDSAFADVYCQDARQVLVVEQKRPFVEEQLRARFAERGVRVHGKLQGASGQGPPPLPAAGELDAATLAAVIGAALGVDSGYLREVEAGREAIADVYEDSKTARLPLYCAGCPHNVSTRVPEGSRAGAGIGCHYMAQWMNRSTHLPTHMGGEGATWTGQAPFTTERHLFVNLGDGTYFHSGLLAIRAALAAGVNITYKILFNDAVAMTGGQPVEGALTVADIVAQVLAEGVAEVRVVAAAPRRVRRELRRRALRARVAGREALDAVQRELRELRGCTVLVYDQACAAQLRRRRKRGLAADPDVRVFINEAVCEGCGDCSAASNCVAVVPVETELGVKRAINQSACNKDLSCLQGFCPAMVTVRGAQPRRRTGGALAALKAELPPPPAAPAAADMLIAGVGGTGVVTVSQLLGTAAHQDGKFASTLDATGLAQKGGAVVSHVRVSPRREAHTPTRIAAASADLLIAADPLTAAGRDVLAMLAPGRTTAVLNRHIAPTAQFVLGESETAARRPDMTRAAARIRARARDVREVDAHAATEAAFGASTTANVFLLGFACQLGAVPVSLEALERAIDLNGVAVADNLAAFHHGRAAAAAQESRPGRGELPSAKGARPVDDRIAYRRAFLVGYQGEALAQRYMALVERARRIEAALRPDGQALADAVAQSYFKLLAVKDEYEVARLFVRGFRAEVAQRFGGRPKITYRFAPTWTLLKDSRGRPRKIAVPHAIAFPLLRALAKLAPIRGTWLDPFRFSAERRLEQRLLARFEADMDAVLARLEAPNASACFDTAVALARQPAAIRGFGPVKAAAAKTALAARDRLFARFFGLAAPETINGSGAGEQA